MYKKLLQLLVCILLFINVNTSPLPQFQHRAVLENAAKEDLLPTHFKNPFYRTPRVREALARHSWFGPGEKPIREREADKIPRSEIYSVLTHAGLIERKF